MRRKTILAVVVIIVAALVGWLLAGLLRPANRKAQWKIITLPTGISVLGLADCLEGEQIVSASGKSALVAAAFLSGSARRLQPGRYRLSPSMSAWQILTYVAQGKVYTVWITIPEGFTLNQIADLLEQEGIASKEEFLALATGEAPSFPADFPKESGSLEGYLFPDTYQIDGRQGAKEVISRMLARFEQTAWKGVFKGDPDHGGLSLHQVLTLASLVEGEARLPKERPVIAGVLLNRLRRGMNLECDATVQYALGERKPRLTYADLQTPSPYNTYLYPGLPPGPINNPGLASIQAALQPEANDYLFYVAKPDGSHVFSKSFAQHRAAVARLTLQGLRGE